MEKFFYLLKEAKLFRGISEGDLENLLDCLGAKPERFEKNRLVFRSGERVEKFGMVLSGRVQIYQDDFYGNRSIFANIGPGHLFGEAFAFAQTESIPVNVVAAEDSDLLFIDSRRLSSPCSLACAFHARLIQNMLGILAQNNIALAQKIEFTSKRTTRAKLLAYLSAQAQAAKSSSFTIPFSRQELADYLSVDRSGLSAELSRLQSEGVLRFNKNRFELK